MKGGDRVDARRAARREAPLTEAELARAAAQAEALNAARLAEGGDPGIWSPAEAGHGVAGSSFSARWPVLALILTAVVLVAFAPVLALEFALFAAPVAAIAGAAVLTRRWLRARRLGAGV
ncbi:MAG: hypothetical protein ACK4WC_14760 [Rubrimonas sp.]